MKNWLAAVALSLPLVAVAGDNLSSGFYAGGGVADVKLSFKGGRSLDWTTGEILGGYKHSPYVGGEARLGYGAENGHDLLYTSFYYRTESANETAKTYLLFGYTLGQSTQSNKAGTNDTTDLNGFSYGVGVGFPVSSQLNFNLEYRMILDGKSKLEKKKQNVELSGASINVDYRF
jgi:opacity protein-like surface antigen